MPVKQGLACRCLLQAAQHQQSTPPGWQAGGPSSTDLYAYPLLPSLGSCSLAYLECVCVCVLVSLCSSAYLVPPSPGSYSSANRLLPSMPPLLLTTAPSSVVATAGLPPLLPLVLLLLLLLLLLLWMAWSLARMKDKSRAESVTGGASFSCQARASAAVASRGRVHRRAETRHCKQLLTCKAEGGGVAWGYWCVRDGLRAVCICVCACVFLEFVFFTCVVRVRACASYHA